MTERSTVSHLLRRVTFGPTAAEVDAAERAGAAAVLDRAFTPAELPDLPDIGPDPLGALAEGASREDRQKARQAVRPQLAEATWWW
jgi:hypothetical protein